MMLSILLLLNVSPALAAYNCGCDVYHAVAAVGEKDIVPVKITSCFGGDKENVERKNAYVVKLGGKGDARVKKTCDVEKLGDESDSSDFSSACDLNLTELELVSSHACK